MKAGIKTVWMRNRVYDIDWVFSIAILSSLTWQFINTQKLPSLSNLNKKNKAIQS